MKIVEMQKAIEPLQADLAMTKGLPWSRPMPCSPLCLAIIDAEVQKRVAKKRPPIPVFDVESDPRVHLSKYSEYMIAMGATDATQF